MMTDHIERALENLLASDCGPVSIVAGIAALRAISVEDSASDLQSLVGTFAAQQGRAIWFDRLEELHPLT